MVLMGRLEWANTAWMLSTFPRAVWYLLSQSAKSEFLCEKHMRRCCPWLSYLEGAVVLLRGQTSLLFLFFLFYHYWFLSLSSKGSWEIKAAARYWRNVFSPFHITIISFSWSQWRFPGVIPMLSTFPMCPMPSLSKKKGKQSMFLRMFYCPFSFF